MMNSRFRILALILYLALIFFISSRPHLRPPGPEFKLKDKLAHLSEYFILGALLFEGFGRGVSRSKFGTFIFLFAVGTSIGALDEIFQSYIPGREMSAHDWLFDAVGVGLGSGVFVHFGLRKRIAMRNRSLPRSEGGAEP
ncbi:MAG: hypothetical protein GTO51_01120 [Candidatus Latescibacteria bacterium]|nr:hypothetical protein [Candidatus Latescibacterota bacterium]NIM21600.1 hypothetical protein [Candidatus Latescibacterota bacterium]NIM64579.1 hypothetical protein [Candidatus Latescibacterota bacterium]NIO01094.1 hypothetical protein [Candidatus Latescibacterota bacterium]NIO27487.1 hypothetical protein [Candidatus Latescibacterota bacterium]